jgi:hypothetical protein
MATIEYRAAPPLPCDIPKMKRAKLEDLAIAQMATILDLEAKVSDARSIAERACRQHNVMLEQKRRVTCVYCGHIYPDGTPESQSALLTAHIKQCHLHPLSKAKNEAKQLRRLLRVALADLTGVRAGRLTPEQLRVFLSDCAAEFGADDNPSTPTDHQAPEAGRKEAK